MRFAVTFSRSSVKALLGMQPKKAAAIRAAIDTVALDPRAKNNNLMALKGVPDGYRLRVGDWRVLFTLDHGAQKMDVYGIAHRREAYR